MEFTQENIDALVQQFPDDQRARVMEILESYGSAAHEIEPVRVRVAALKLANGKLSELEYLMKHARQDYRDVLAWASLRGHPI